MPTLTRGSANDLTRSGFTITPPDQWALATEGFWIELRSTDIPIGHPGCWLPIVIADSPTLPIEVGAGPIAVTIQNETPIAVEVESGDLSIVVEDSAIVRVKIC